MANSHLKLVTPSTVNRTVNLKRLPNADLRTREYRTEAEIERLMTAAKGQRDLRWDQADFQAATLHVRRVKHGTPSAHPIVGDELRALRRLRTSKNRNPHLSSRQHTVRYTEMSPTRFKEFWRRSQELAGFAQRKSVSDFQGQS